MRQGYSELALSGAATSDGSASGGALCTTLADGDQTCLGESAVRRE